MLHQFVANRDEAAFAALVSRHGPMVWALCRRLLHRLPDAEDAFQATFLVLVRKANAIRQPDLLGPWLHGVAYRVAVRLRMAIARERIHQHSDLDLPAPEVTPEAEQKELRLLLDREVSRLPEHYRVPFVLCHLEGLTNEEAARRLRCPKGTILSRLSRARERLRLRLTRRGVGLSAAAVAAAMIEPADAGPVPATLSATTARLASGVVSGAVSAASGGTAVALMEGVVTSMYLAKLKVAAAILLTLGLVGAGGTMLAKSGDAPLRNSITRVQADVRDGLIAAKAEAKAREDEPAPAIAGRRSDVEIRDKLAKVVKFEGLEDPKTTLAWALDLLSAKHGVSFHVNERAFAEENIDNVQEREIVPSRPMPLSIAPLATVLNRILDRIPAKSGAVFLIRKGYVEITTGQAARGEINLGLYEPFLPLVYEHFEETPLLDALKALGDHADVNVVVEPSAVATIQNMKISAPFHNVPAETAVRVLAQMGGLDMIRLGNVLYVLPKAEAEKLRPKWIPPDP